MQDLSAMDFVRHSWHALSNLPVLARMLYKADTDDLHVVRSFVASDGVGDAAVDLVP